MRTKRVPCLHGCGTMVLRELGECRDCRRKRIHAGHKRLAKLNRTPGIVAYIKLLFETAKQKYQRSKSVSWNRPKRQSVVRERRRALVDPAKFWRNE